MDNSKKAIIRKRVDKVIDNLRKNNILGMFVEKKEDVAAMAEKLLAEGETVAVGGSMSLFECGIINLLRSGKYNFLDRYEDELTREQINQIFIDSFSADTYLCSSNAVTENGELYNVDGNSNRIAAICFGPKSVIMVVGINKIVKDLDEAVIRVKNIAAPANATRLGCKTYCKEKGECMSEGSELAGGCKSDARICCSYVVNSFQRVKDRIKVIIVGEEIGY